MPINYPNSSDTENRLLAKLLKNGVGPAEFISGDSTWNILRKLVANQATGIAASSSDTERALIAKLLLNNANASGGGGGDSAFAGDEYDAYVAAVGAAGGTLTTLSESVALNHLVGLWGKSYNRKILWISPFLGSDIAAGLVALRHWIANAPAVTNNGYVDGDLVEAVGLTGDGTSYADLNFFPPHVGYFGGIGSVVGGALDVNGSVIGSFNFDASQRWTLALRAVGHFLTWGAGSGAVSAVTPGSGHFYGQRSGDSLRSMYRNGVLNATDVDSDTTIPTIANDFFLGASNFNGVANTINTSAHIIKFVYMTNGLMTAAEVLDYYNLVQDTVITPLGR